MEYRVIGGGGGNRTRVRKQCRTDIYMFVRRLALAPPHARRQASDGASLLRFRIAGGDAPVSYPACTTFLPARAGSAGGNVVALRRPERKNYLQLLFSDRD